MQEKEQFMASIRKIPGMPSQLMEAVDKGFSAVFESGDGSPITGWISLKFPDATAIEGAYDLSSAAADLEPRFIDVLATKGFKTIETNHGKDGELELDVEFPPAFVPEFMKSTPESIESDSSSEESAVSNGQTEETETEGHNGVTLTYLLSTGSPSVSSMGFVFSESIPGEEDIMEASTLTVHIDNPRGPYLEIIK